jgi:hypothetical protein
MDLSGTPVPNRFLDFDCRDSVSHNASQTTPFKSNLGQLSLLPENIVTADRSNDPDGQDRTVA